MSGNWKPSNHTVGDFKDWNDENKLVMRPPFQRNAVWTQTSRIMLIDTLLKNYPIPKIFIQNAREDDKTVRKIIDGQQRISAILDYINDEFILEDPYEGNYQGLKFSELPKETQETMLQFTIDCNEAYGYTDGEYREIYTRLNKYTIPLNRQELRKAEFPGNFYQLAEKIANLEILEDWKIFNLASRRRLLDVEFISEILASLLEGPQEKKQTLDDFYRKYNEKDLQELEDNVLIIINEINILFPSNEISKTRFKQKSDFYSLFLALSFFVNQGMTLKGRNTKYLKEDFVYLDQFIEPYDEDSGVTILNEYALRCIGSANSLSSRKWRTDFLKLILAGTYYDNQNFIELYSLYKEDEYLSRFIDFYKMGDPTYHDSGYCPLGSTNCALCDDEVDLEKYKWMLVWRKNSPIQLSSLLPIHKYCNDSDICVDYSNLTEYSDFKNKNDQDDFVQDLFKDLDND